MSKALKFEIAFQRLEEIARLLENGEVSLEESVQLYEEGMKLIRFCADKLTEAEKAILVLSKTADGSFQTERLEGDL